LGPLTNLIDIISGRRYHKNTTNNAAVRALWSATDQVDPAVREKFRDFIASAGAVAEAMFWSTEKPGDINPKKYGADQFRMFYDAIVAAYAYMYAKANPELARELAASMWRLVSNPESIRRLVKKLDARSSFDREAAGDVWSYLIDEARIGRVGSLAQFTTFTTACAYGYKAAVERRGK